MGKYVLLMVLFILTTWLILLTICINILTYPQMMREDFVMQGGDTASHPPIAKTKP